jgi:hypothetical protein
MEQRINAKLLQLFFSQISATFLKQKSRGVIKFWIGGTEYPSLIKAFRINSWNFLYLEFSNFCMKK